MAPCTKTRQVLGFPFFSRVLSHSVITLDSLLDCAGVFIVKDQVKLVLSCLAYYTAIIMVIFQLRHWRV